MRTDSANEIIWAVVAATALFVLLIAFCISYVLIYRRKRKEHQNELQLFKNEFENQLLKSTIEVQESTFQQIGQELHDNVGQLLSTSRMLLGLTERALKTPPDTLLTANATLAQAIGELRSLSKTLDKDWLAQFSFSENLQTEIDRINAGDVIRAEVINCIDPDLSRQQQIMVFRIVQEAIQNAVKHAKPTKIVIEMKELDTGLEITITDDGSGMSASLTGGLGIKNMKHRTRLLGGSIHWNSNIGVGTTVCVLLPVKQMSE